MNSIASRDELEPLQKIARGYAQNIDTIGYELYFGSAYDAEQKSKAQAETRTSITSAVKRRFLSETETVLRALGNSGLPSAIYHAVKTLAFLVEAEPKKVLLLISEALKAPANARYVTDSMAKKDVFELLEGYLANHRDLLVFQGPCRDAFLDILDAFAKAGHSEALSFAQRAAEELR